MGRGALSINTVCVQVVEVWVSPALAWGGQGHFLREDEVEILRDVTRVTNEAGRSI